MDQRNTVCFRKGLQSHEGTRVQGERDEVFAAIRALGKPEEADTGILDYMFERYLADNATRPMDFWTWVETVYDADEINRTFKASGWANRLVNGVLQRE